MKQFDVAALGELLIDFTENGVSGQGNGLFEACPGGASWVSPAPLWERWATTCSARC